MTQQRFLLGIDCGSTMVKAAIFDVDGKECAVAARKIEHIYRHPGWTENDMNALWQSTCEVSREVLDKSKIDPKGVACVTCTGHGNGFISSPRTMPRRATESSRPTIAHGNTSNDGRPKTSRERSCPRRCRTSGPRSRTPCFAG